MWHDDGSEQEYQLELKRIAVSHEKTASAKSHDAALVEHLAKVMGWTKQDYAHPHVGSFWKTGKDIISAIAWNPLGSWADAGMVIDKLQAGARRDSKAYYILRATGRELLLQDGDEFMLHSGPRAICEAVARASGWHEPEGGEHVGR